MVQNDIFPFLRRNQNNNKKPLKGHPKITKLSLCSAHPINASCCTDWSTSRAFCDVFNFFVHFLGQVTLEGADLLEPFRQRRDVKSLISPDRPKVTHMGLWDTAVKTQSVRHGAWKAFRCLNNKRKNKMKKLFCVPERATIAKKKITTSFENGAYTENLSIGLTYFCV